MRNRSSLYIGVMVLVLGAMFLVMNIGSTIGGVLSIVSMGNLWPLIVIWVGLGFFIPIFIWWDSRHKNYGLAMPGTIVLVNGLILFYCNLSGNWGAWAYLWTLEPFSVALGLLALYFLGPKKEQGLLVAAAVIGGASLAVFAILASALGGPIGGVVGAFLLIALGIILVARAIVQRS